MVCAPTAASFQTAVTMSYIKNAPKTIIIIITGVIMIIISKLGPDLCLKSVERLLSRLLFIWLKETDGNVRSENIREVENAAWDYASFHKTSAP